MNYLWYKYQADLLINFDVSQIILVHVAVSINPAPTQWFNIFLQFRQQGMKKRSANLLFPAYTALEMVVIGYSPQVLLETQSLFCSTHASMWSFERKMQV